MGKHTNTIVVPIGRTKSVLGRKAIISSKNTQLRILNCLVSNNEGYQIQTQDHKKLQQIKIEKESNDFKNSLILCLKPKVVVSNVSTFSQCK